MLFGQARVHETELHGPASSYCQVRAMGRKKMDLNRRAFVLGLPAAAVCSSLPAGPSLAQKAIPRSTYQAMYAPIEDDLYPIPGVDLSRIDPNYLRKVVSYGTSEEPGTIVVDPH